MGSSLSVANSVLRIINIVALETLLISYIFPQLVKNDQQILLVILLSVFLLFFIPEQITNPFGAEFRVPMHLEILIFYALMFLIYVSALGGGVNQMVLIVIVTAMLYVALFPRNIQGIDGLAANRFWSDIYA